jgi:predicted adenylyl cyclase CyaB
LRYDAIVRNLEYKARIDAPNALAAKARALGFDLWGDLRQTDTYFATPNGRLKLRETAGFQAELIFYERDENGADRPSDYEVAHSHEPDALRNLLTGVLGVLGTVRKRRTLLVLDGTRVHLDNVEGLGTFMEIEVPVSESDLAARERMDWLLGELGLAWDGGIRASYLDLTLGATNTKT